MQPCFLTLLQRAGMPPDSLTTVYTTIFRSVMEYACQVWHMGLTDKQSETLESIQKCAMVIISPDLSHGDALAKLGLPTLHDRREHLCRRFFQAMLQPAEHWSLTACGLSQWAKSSDGLDWQLPIHCFVIIDGLCFLSLIVHFLAHYAYQTVKLCMNSTIGCNKLDLI